MRRAAERRGTFHGALRSSTSTWTQTVLAGAALLALSSCHKEPLGALRVELTVAGTAQSATCVRVEVRQADRVLASASLERNGVDHFLVGIERGELPETITVRAVGLVGRGLKPCDEPLIFNGQSPAVDATFPKTGVVPVPLTLGAPTLDADGDGYLGLAAQGSDCDDGRADIHPGATQSCEGSEDLNCDGLSGCADPVCSAAPACNEAPAALAFVAVPPSSLQTNTCSGEVIVEVRGQSNTPVFLKQAAVVELSAAGPSLDFFADSVCGQGAVQVAIPVGKSRARFSFSGATVGMGTLTAAMTGVTSASHDYVLAPPPQPSLAFVGTPPTQVVAGACSAPLTLEVLDVGGAPLPQATPLSIVVSSTPSSLKLFAGDTCNSGEEVSSVRIDDGGTRLNFRVSDTVAGPHQLVASATGVQSATWLLGVTPAGPAALSFTSPPQGIATDTCSGPLQVSLVDRFGNQTVAATSAALTAGLTTTSGGAVTGVALFDSATCDGGRPALNLAAGASRAQPFFAQGSTTQVVNVTVSAQPAQTWQDATQRLAVGAGAPTQLGFTPAPAPVTAGDCAGPITVQLLDASGTPSNNRGTAAVGIGLSSAPADLSFFSDQGCSASITAVNVQPNAAGATYFFRSTRAGSPTVTATSAALGSKDRPESIVAGAPTRLVLTPAQTKPAGTCSDAFRLEIQDRYLNPTRQGTPLTVSLSATPGPMSFFSQAGCASGALAGTVDIPLGMTGVSLFARSDVAATHVLRGVAAFGTAGQTFTVSPGDPDHLKFVAVPASQLAGVCTPMASVRVEDAKNNPVAPSATVASQVALDTTSASQVAFYPSTGCAAATPISEVSIGAGQTQASFTLQGQRTETVTLRARLLGVTEATAPFEVQLGPPAKLRFTSPSRFTTPNTCSPDVVRVETQDLGGNPSPVPAAITVGLAVNLPGLTLSGGGCVTPLTSVGIGQSTSAAQFVYKGADAGVWTVTASSGALLSDTTQLAVANPIPTIVEITVQGSGSTQFEAGACLKATATRRTTASGPPVVLPVATDLTFTSAASSVRWYGTDPTCGAVTNRASIPAGASSVEVYWRPISGLDNAVRTETLQVNALPPLSGDTVNVQFRPMVRHGTCRITNNTTSCAVNLPVPPDDLSRTFLVFQSSSDHDSPVGANVTCRLALNGSVPQVVCDRQGQTPELYLSWQTVSFGRPLSEPGGALVQRLKSTCVDGMPLPNNRQLAIPTAVVPSQSFLLFSSSSDGLNNDGNDFLTAELVDAATVQLRAPNLLSATNCVNDATYDVQVVSINGADVQRKVEAPGPVFTVPVSAQRLWSRTFVLYSAKNDDEFGPELMCKRRLRADVTNGQLSFKRGLGSGNANCTGTAASLEALSWEAVQLAPGNRVLRSDVQLIDGTSTATPNLSSAVDWSRTMVLTGGQGPSGQGAGETTLQGTNNDFLGSAMVRLDQSGPTNFTALRGKTTGDSRFTVFVVELDP